MPWFDSDLDRALPVLLNQLYTKSCIRSEELHSEEEVCGADSLEKPNWGGCQLQSSTVKLFQQQQQQGKERYVPLRGTFSLLAGEDTWTTAGIKSTAEDDTVVA